MNNSLGDRMKGYEINHRLTQKTPIIIRVDGKAFHTFTSKFQKPFDMKLINSMLEAGEKTAREMMGFRLGYQQSDEFTFYLSDTDKFESEAWFDGDLQKIASVSASLFTAYFNRAMGGTIAVFDSRAFTLPFEEVPNVFIWRQRDWERNSLQMLTRSLFSHKQVLKKNSKDMHEMLFTKGINWSDLDNVLKNGTFVTKKYERVCEKLDYNRILDLITNTQPMAE